jgi:hypothetical protein
MGRCRKIRATLRGMLAIDIKNLKLAVYSGEGVKRGRAVSKAIDILDILFQVRLWVVEVWQNQSVWQFGPPAPSPTAKPQAGNSSSIKITFDFAIAIGKPH